MDLTKNVKKIFSLFLWLVSLHSFLVGIAMIFPPEIFMQAFEFLNVDEVFFRMQAGAFHILMSIIYGMAAINVDKFRNLVTVSIIAKMLATIFLIAFFILQEKIWIVLISGITDFMMGIILWNFQILNKKAHKAAEKEQATQADDPDTKEKELDDALPDKDPSPDIINEKER
jgi:hypothetical protein